MPFVEIYGQTVSSLALVLDVTRSLYGRPPVSRIRESKQIKAVGMAVNHPLPRGRFKLEQKVSIQGWGSRACMRTVALTQCRPARFSRNFFDFKTALASRMREDYPELRC